MPYLRGPCVFKQDVILLKRPRTVCHDILVAENGKTSAVGYWFDVNLYRNNILSTAANLEASHFD